MGVRAFGRWDTTMNVERVIIGIIGALRPLPHSRQQISGLTYGPCEVTNERREDHSWRRARRRSVSTLRTCMAPGGKGRDLPRASSCLRELGRSRSPPDKKADGIVGLCSPARGEERTGVGEGA